MDRGWRHCTGRCRSRAAAERGKPGAALARRTGQRTRPGPAARPGAPAAIDEASDAGRAAAPAPVGVPGTAVDLVRSRSARAFPYRRARLRADDGRSRLARATHRSAAVAVAADRGPLPGRTVDGQRPSRGGDAVTAARILAQALRASRLRVAARIAAFAAPLLLVLAALAWRFGSTSWTFVIIAIGLLATMCVAWMAMRRIGTQ